MMVTRLFSFSFFLWLFLADWCNIQVPFSHDEPLHRTCYAGHFGSHILDSAHVVSPTRYGWRRAKAQGRVSHVVHVSGVSLAGFPLGS